MAELLRIEFNAEKAAKQLGILTDRGIKQFRVAVRKTMEQASVRIEKRAEADIMRAGKFSARWPAAFTVNTRYGEASAAMSVGFSREIPYAHVHEFGATIRGKPLLWIPLSFSDVPVIGPGSTRMWARNYPGGLFRVTRPGRKPLLFSKLDKKPKYVGVEHVTLKPRFHIRSIVANVVRTELAKMFAGYVKGVKL